MEMAYWCSLASLFFVQLSVTYTEAASASIQGITRSLNPSTSNLNISMVSVSLATEILSRHINATESQQPLSTTPISAQVTTSFSTTNVFATSSVPSKNNTVPYFCARYPGGVCGKVLNTTLTQFNESDRIFDRKYGVAKTEEFAVNLFNILGKKKSTGRCKWILQVAVCQASFPACLPGTKPTSLCKEDCEALWHECNDDLNRLTGFGEALTQLKQMNFLHLESPSNCSVFPSEKDGNNTCFHIDLFDHSKTSTESSIKKVILFWLIGAAFVFIIIILLVVLCWKCRKDDARRKASEVSLGMTDISSSNPTMKERVNSMPELPTLTSKIAELFDPAKLRQFSLDKIDYVCDLGEGQFGLVFKGIAKGLLDPQDPSLIIPVAVKTLKADSNEDSRDEFHKEVVLMSVLDHPNIVRLMAVATEEDPYCMIFEFMEYGDLNKFLREIKPLDDTEEPPDIQLCLEDFLSACSQVACGMQYLASLHFVHRDLATRNCLVGKGLVVKIADFGMSRDIYSADYYKVHGDAMLPVRWMPPEALLHGRFTVLSDIYSYGVLIWEVFTYALQPFYGYSNEEVMGFARQGILLGQPDDCPTHIYQLMRDCWHRKPESRPDFATIGKRLVPTPTPSNYAVPNPDHKSNTVEIRKPGTTPLIKSTYQTPGTLINSGFKPDSPNKDVSSSNPKLDNSECDV